MAQESDREVWIHARVADLLRERRLTAIAIRERTGFGVSTVKDLVCDHEFTVIDDLVPGDRRTWNTHPGVMDDVIGGMTPDIVVRSAVARPENRIYIEAKSAHGVFTHADHRESQVIRYFLHLLATSHVERSEPSIRRAVLVAAPSRFFDSSRAAGGAAWRYFHERYRDLAEVFGVVIGEIHSEDL